MTRRTLLSLLAAPAAAADPAMLWNHVERLLRENDERRRAALEAVNGPAARTALRSRVRSAMLRAIGGLPQRTDLAPRTAGELRRDGYRIEKVIYQSRPGFSVTGNLYLPAGAGRHPAVLHSCGHSVNGKASAAYQRVSIGLARLGFVVLTFDPIGQGERFQYAGIRQPTVDHARSGRQAYLTGATLAQFRIWDAIRGLDYLETRPEVDPRRLGMIGQSGGGMLTLITAPLDERIRAAMSACAVATYYHKTLAGLIADPEQIQPGLLGSGIDHPELIASVAPRPFLICAARRDFVPIDGARRTFQEVRPHFPPGTVAIAETDDVHNLNRELREATYAWMLRHLAGRDESPSEPELAIEKDEDLQCTPAGSVFDTPGARRVFDFTRATARTLAARRPAAVDPGAVRALLGLPPDLPPPRRIGARIETEPGIALPLDIEGDGTDLLLVVSPDGRRPAWATGRVAILQPRGWGATAPDRPEDFFAYRGYELGRPLLGMRVLDVLQCVRLLRADFPRISVAGEGPAGIVALHALVLDPEIAAAQLRATPESYEVFLERADIDAPVASFPAGVLRTYDLPALIEAAGPGRVIRG
ncbi:MAG: acetylxylan esterase [Bryobacterales bacterium]|nr:acetylxylan esterase [Bryobacterales bacterium]